MKDPGSSEQHSRDEMELGSFRGRGKCGQWTSSRKRRVRTDRTPKRVQDGGCGPNTVWTGMSRNPKGLSRGTTALENQRQALKRPPGAERGFVSSLTRLKRSLCSRAHSSCTYCSLKVKHTPHSHPVLGEEMDHFSPLPLLLCLLPLQPYRESSLALPTPSGMGSLEICR